MGIITINMKGPAGPAAEENTEFVWNELNFLFGTSGADVINKTGESRQQVIYSGTGADIVIGGNAADYIDGGEGNDTLRGEGRRHHHRWRWRRPDFRRPRRECRRHRAGGWHARNIRQRPGWRGGRRHDFRRERRRHDRRRQRCRRSVRQRRDRHHQGRRWRRHDRWRSGSRLALWRRRKRQDFRRRQRHRLRWC